MTLSRAFTRGLGAAFCCLFLLTASSASAQQWLASLDFLVGLPQGDFKSNVGKSALGVAGTIGYAPASIPFMAGLKFGFMNYGNEERREPFSTTIPDVTVAVRTSNNLFTTHGVLRLQVNQGVLRPYLQGMAGMNYLFTETKIENIGRSGEEVASSTNQDDVVFSYGAGGGLMICVSSDLESDAIKEWLIDLRASYIRGGEAEYLKPGSIRREAGTVRFDTIRSRTDLVTIHAGVAVRF